MCAAMARSGDVTDPKSPARRVGELHHIGRGEGCAMALEIEAPRGPSGSPAYPGRGVGPWAIIADDRLLADSGREDAHGDSEGGS